MTKQNKVETVAVAKPHPLKGIINSNDDPMACALCSQALVFDGSTFNRLTCCGIWTCKDCNPFALVRSAPQCKRKERRTPPTYLCASCSMPYPKGSHEMFARLKKVSKRGHPWGQYLLAQMLLDKNYRVDANALEAFRWASKAASKGHVEAHALLASMRIDGLGCARDLIKARHHTDTFLSMNSEVVNSEGVLLELATAYIADDNPSEAKSILCPIAKGICLASSKAQFHLGRVFMNEENYLAAFHMFKASALFSLRSGQIGSPALNAFVCAKRTGQLVQVRLWSRIAKEVLEIEFRDPQSVFSKNNFGKNIAALADSKKMLRSARDTCGGCNAKFEGKERKFCRGCRTYCYCSRECQKLHWNRKNDGHRDACKAAIEVRKTIKEARHHGLKLGK